MLLVCKQTCSLLDIRMHLAGYPNFAEGNVGLSLRNCINTVHFLETLNKYQLLYTSCTNLIIY